MVGAVMTQGRGPSRDRLGNMALRNMAPKGHRRVVSVVRGQVLSVRPFDRWAAACPPPRSGPRPMALMAGGADMAARALGARLGGLVRSWLDGRPSTRPARWNMRSRPGWRQG